ncbi:hypothetical protein FO519_001589 [Halicephalobus sp. NKZ332]|nr:hypothetical protein FO519_001589 [Halicephalobus sp. NKZ332]
MNEAEQCSQQKEEVADDWENAGDEALIASVAERQKRLAQMESKLAAEQQQLKLEQVKPSSSQNDKKAEVRSGPVKLLRRPQSGSTLNRKTDAEIAREAEERAQKALEEREVAYQQAREKIFGGEQLAGEQPEIPTNEAIEEYPQPSTSINKDQTSKDYLSDVPMKRADTYKFPPKPVVPPIPPLMSSPMGGWRYPGQVPCSGPPGGLIPPFYDGIPPNVMPPYCMSGPLNPFTVPPPPIYRPTVQMKNVFNQPMPHPMTQPLNPAPPTSFQHQLPVFTGVVTAPTTAPPQFGTSKKDDKPVLAYGGKLAKKPGV